MSCFSGLGCTSSLSWRSGDGPRSRRAHVAPRHVIAGPTPKQSTALRLSFVAVCWAWAGHYHQPWWAPMLVRVVVTGQGYRKVPIYWAVYHDLLPIASADVCRARRPCTQPSSSSASYKTRRPSL
jgi:hypothetical protein